jgi:c(7)-type cytochrome triheme protein
MFYSFKGATIMRKIWSSLVISGALVAAFLLAGSAKAEGAKDKKESPKVEAKEAASEEKAPEAAPTMKTDPKDAPEFIVYDKAKMGAVKFPHAAHAELLGKCEVCHGGETPLFPQKKTEGMLMKDMYAGKSCGHCHDGKKKQGDKVIFAAKGACTKCHVKAKK